MKFSVFQLSRRGGRPTNEDRMGYCYTREAGLFVLADGMGGHAEGEVASQLALQTLAAEFQRQATPRLPDVQAFLQQGVMLAHERIFLRRYRPRVGAVVQPVGGAPCDHVAHMQGPADGVAAPVARQ